MKLQILDSNGFPRPLGMILIFFLISITCFANLVIINKTKSGHADNGKSIFTIKSDHTPVSQDIDPLKSYLIKY